SVLTQPTATAHGEESQTGQQQPQQDHGPQRQRLSFRERTGHVPHLPREQPARSQPDSPSRVLRSPRLGESGCDRVRVFPERPEVIISVPASRCPPIRGRSIDPVVRFVPGKGAGRAFSCWQGGGLFPYDSNIAPTPISSTPTFSAFSDRQGTHRWR